MPEYASRFFTRVKDQLREHSSRYVTCVFRAGGVGVIDRAAHVGTMQWVRRPSRGRCRAPGKAWSTAGTATDSAGMQRTRRPRSMKLIGTIWLEVARSGQSSAKFPREFRPVAHRPPLRRSNARSATRPDITRISPVTRGKLGAAAIAGSGASSTADEGQPRLRADSVAELRVRLFGSQDHVILDRVLALDIRECVLG